MAVDESEESMHALSWCLSHLLPSHAILVLLYVKPPPPTIYSFFDATGYLLSGDATAEVQKLGTHMVHSVMERAEAVRCIFNHNVSVERFIRTGDAWEVICKAVDMIRADTLVMGCHGFGFMKRALLGSVSEYCSKHGKHFGDRLIAHLKDKDDRKHCYLL